MSKPEPKRTRTVVALRLGFRNGGRVRPGTVFEVPVGEKASWYVDHSPLSAPEAPAAEQQVALSQMGRDKPKSMVEVLKGKASDLV